MADGSELTEVIEGKALVNRLSTRVPTGFAARRIACKTANMMVVTMVLISATVLPALADWFDDPHHGERHASDLNESKFYGTVENIPCGGIGAWVVNGRAIIVTRETRIKEKYGLAATGSYVEIKGNNTGKTFIAYKVEVKRSRK